MALRESSAVSRVQHLLEGNDTYSPIRFNWVRNWYKSAAACPVRAEPAHVTGHCCNRASKFARIVAVSRGRKRRSALITVNYDESASLDGRYFGALPVSLIIGRTVPLWMVDEAGKANITCHQAW